MNRWRLLDPGPLPAWRQMALDSVVIRARAAGKAPDTFRFMEFSPHTALVGLHQAIDLELDRDACHALGVEYNRRITGGGAIYMDTRQLGWELCIGKDNPGLPVDPSELYPRLAAVVVTALKEWGIAARFRPVNDVEVEGRKISGTGGAEWGGALIYQGTLLVDFDIDTMLRVLRLPVEKLTDKVIDSFRQRVVTMRELLHRAPPMAEVKQTLVAAVEQVLGVRVEPAGLTEEEMRDWEAVAGDFQSPGWIDRRRPPAAGYDLRTARFKAPGGLLQAHLLVDPTASRIRRAFLTGDFFVYPERAVLDLEAQLKESAATPEALRAIVEAHYQRGYRYLGVTPADWTEVFRLALDPVGTERRWQIGHDA